MYKPIGRFVYDGASVSIAASGKVQFSSSTVQTNAISYDGEGGISLKAPGTYMVSANFTTAATAANDQEIQMYADGTAVAGAHAASTAGAIGDSVSISFNGVETVVPATSGNATLTFVNGANATSIQIACVVVEKVS